MSPGFLLRDMFNCQGSWILPLKWRVLNSNVMISFVLWNILIYHFISFLGNFGGPARLPLSHRWSERRDCTYTINTMWLLWKRKGTKEHLPSCKMVSSALMVRKHRTKKNTCDVEQIDFVCNICLEKHHAHKHHFQVSIYIYNITFYAIQFAKRYPPWN